MSSRKERKGIFCEVQAQVNPEILGNSVVKALLEEHLKNGLKIEHAGKICLLTGTLPQVSAFHRELQEKLIPPAAISSDKQVIKYLSANRVTNGNVEEDRSLTRYTSEYVQVNREPRQKCFPNIIICGEARGEVKSFLQRLLRKPEKSMDCSYEFQESRTFQLMPFCIMMYRHFTIIDLFIQDVKVFVEDINLPHLKLTFSASNKSSLEELLRVIQTKYRENEIFIHKKIDGLPAKYVKKLKNAVLNELRPKLLIFVENTSIFMESATGSSAKLDQVMKHIRKDHVQSMKQTAGSNARMTGSDADQTDSMEGESQLNSGNEVDQKVEHKELRVDVDTMEYIRLYHSDDLELLASTYHVVLDDSRATKGTIYVLPSKRTTNREIDTVVEKIGDYIQNIYSSIRHIVIDTRRAQEKTTELYWQIVELARDNRVYLQQKCTKFYLVGTEDDVTTLEFEIRNLLGLHPPVVKHKHKLRNTYRQELKENHTPESNSKASFQHELKQHPNYDATVKLEQQNYRFASEGTIKSFYESELKHNQSLGIEFTDRAEYEREAKHKGSTVAYSKSSHTEVDCMTSLGDKQLTLPIWYLHTKSGVSVIASVADIRQLLVDAVVHIKYSSAAVHPHGVVLAVPRFEGNDSNRKYSYLGVSDTCVTPCGSILTNKVIHAVCPDYKDNDTSKYLRDLSDMVTNVLKSATSERLHSIAIPAVESGGLESLTADVVVTSISDFLSGHMTTSLTTIRLVHTDHGMVVSMQDSLDKQVKAGIFNCKGVAPPAVMGSTEGGDKIVKPQHLSANARATMSKSRDAMSNSRDTMSNSKDIMSNSRDIISSTRATMSNSRDTMSNSRDIISSTRATISNSRDTMSNSRDTMSNSRDTFSSTRGTTPNSRDTIPSARGTIHEFSEDAFMSSNKIPLMTRSELQPSADVEYYDMKRDGRQSYTDAIRNDNQSSSRDRLKQLTDDTVKVNQVEGSNPRRNVYKSYADFVDSPHHEQSYPFSQGEPEQGHVDSVTSQASDALQKASVREPETVHREYISNHSSDTKYQLLQREPVMTYYVDNAAKFYKSSARDLTEGHYSSRKPQSARAHGESFNTAKPKIKVLEHCCICLSELTNPKTLSKCNHTFCTECIDKGFKFKPVCPVCGEIYGKLIGDQPPDGIFEYSRNPRTRLPGYETVGTIEIKYRFPDGLQTRGMPHPGQYYTGTCKLAYLPDNSDGRKVLKLLEQAFKSRLIFTVGFSPKAGISNVIVWNDIPHKTNIHGGPENCAYPDPGYLTRVQQVLASKGIK